MQHLINNDRTNWVFNIPGSVPTTTPVENLPVESDKQSSLLEEFAAKKLTREQVYELVYIGFSRPALYKRVVWLKAKAFMENVVCPLGYAFPHDFGVRSGKFSTHHNVEDVQDSIASLIAID